MNNNGKITSWAIIILIIIVGCIYFIARSNLGKLNEPTDDAPTEHTVTVHYFCEEGALTASYGTNKVTLTLPNARSIELAQSISGSGVRYEGAGAVFVSKGSNAMLEENGTTTYANCVAGSRAAIGGSYNFTDEAKSFSFMYPSAGMLSGSMGGYGLEWRENTDKNGLLLAKVTIPGSIQPKTNFASSRFTVGTSSDAAAVKNCLTDTANGAGKGTKVTINGTTFTKFMFSDAGAGNLYDTTSYRTVRNGQCYAIEYTIHSTQLANYPAELGIQAYDKAAITELFEGMAQSFKFL